MGKLLVSLIIICHIIPPALCQADHVIDIPDDYIFYKDYIGNKSNCILANDILYVVTSTNEDIKVQEPISDTGIIKKQYVLAIDLNTNDIKVVGNPGSYKADGYTFVNGLMHDSNQLYVKTSNRYNVYDTKTYALIRNCSSDIYTNSYGIMHDGFMYSTSMGALDKGLDNIGIMLKEEIDAEYTPDTKFMQPRFFLPYKKYVTLFGMDINESRTQDNSQTGGSKQIKYMKEGYRSEFILQDWIYLVAGDTLYAASAFGTDFYIMSLQGDSLSLHALSGFESIRKSELEKNPGLVRTPANKFSRLSKMLYDNYTNNILFYFSVSEASRVNKDDNGFYLVWSLADVKEITGLRPIDYVPLKLENNIITGIKLVNNNDLQIREYDITTK